MEPRDLHWPAEFTNDNHEIMQKWIARAAIRTRCDIMSKWQTIILKKKNIIQTENFIYLRVTSEEMERMLNQSDARATKNGRRGMMETLP